MKSKPRPVEFLKNSDERESLVKNVGENSVKNERK